MLPASFFHAHACGPCRGCRRFRSFRPRGGSGGLLRAMHFFQPPDDFVEIAFADYVPSANDDVPPCLQRIHFFVLRQRGNGAEPLLGRARYDDDFAVPNRLFDQGEGVALGREYFFSAA